MQGLEEVLPISVTSSMVNQISLSLEQARSHDCVMGSLLDCDMRKSLRGGVSPFTPLPFREKNRF